MFAGAAIYYKTRLQPTIAQSSTEAEFVNMADAGKAALYIRWILEELKNFQTKPTPIQADNTGAISLANAQKPTRRTCHVELKHMVVLQWTDNELINYKTTKSASNYSDSLLKPTEQMKFSQHCDIFMGRKRQAYAKVNEKQKRNVKISNTILSNPIIHYISCYGLKNSKRLLNNPLYALLNEQQFTYSLNS